MRKLILFLSFTLAGCGTLIHSGMQQVGFSSSPAGAKVSVMWSQRDVVRRSKGDYPIYDTVQKKLTCTTPCSLNLDRAMKTYDVLIEKEGYETASATIQRGASGWMFGNLLFGGPIGFFIDIGSGGGFNLDPPGVNVSLAKK